VALYTQDSIERLKQAIDIVEIVGARTELRRVGARFTGLCPFHEERTPSFSVNPELSLFHCFGCQESGDAIGFVQKTEAMDFREAVELLADRYGVELKRRMRTPRRRNGAGCASGCWDCSTARPTSMPAICGSRARPGLRATTCASGGWGRRCSRPFGSATRQAPGTRS
jgi:hypothetical protein